MRNLLLALLTVGVFASSELVTPDESKLTIAPKSFRDLRTITNLADATGGNHESVEGNTIDISTKRASEMYANVMEGWNAAGNPTSFSKFILHEIEDAENNQLVEEWKIEYDDQQKKVFKCVIRTLDINNKESPVHNQEIRYSCAYYGLAEKTFCVPDNCNLKDFIPKETPAHKCANNYSYSQDVVRTVMEFSDTQTQTPVDEHVYRVIMECIEEKVEKLDIVGENICYFIGFQPENMVSLETLTQQLADQKFYWLEGNTFEKRTVVETHLVKADIDKIEQTLVDAIQVNTTQPE